MSEKKENIPDDSYNDVHVMPNDDKHECSKNCWCEPHIIADFTDDGGVKEWLHKELQ